MVSVRQVACLPSRSESSLSSSHRFRGRQRPEARPGEGHCSTEWAAQQGALNLLGLMRGTTSALLARRKGEVSLISKEIFFYTFFL